MPRITFSEQPLDTLNPVFGFTNNSVRFVGSIVTDGAQPGSPVIAANRSFSGPVSFTFERPVTRVSLDAGYFDNIGSTTIVFLSAGGAVLGTFSNQAMGVRTFTLTSTVGIAEVRVINRGFDANGFSVDNVDFGDVANDFTAALLQVVPTISASEAATAINQGALGRASVFLPDSVGGTDDSDLFRFDLQSDSIVTLTLTMIEDASKSRQLTFEGKAGANFYRVLEGTGFETPHGYRVTYVVTPKPDTEDSLISQIVDGIFSDVAGGTFSATELLAEYGPRINQLSQNGAIKLLGKIEGKLGVAGILFDAGSRTNDIVDAFGQSTYRGQREIAVQAIEGSIAYALQLGLPGAGAIYGGLWGGIAGAGGAFLYSILASNYVQSLVSDAYDARYGPVRILEDDSLSGLAALTAPFVARFDSAFYLATYTDAATAVSSGSASSAIAHYLAVGVGRGYRPNATDGAVQPGSLLFQVVGNDPALGPREPVGNAPLGNYAGDRMSEPERALLDLANAERPSTGALGADATLFALANRLAVDAMGDALSPFIRGARGTFVADLTLNDGRTLATVFPTADLTGVTAYAVAVENGDPAQALAQFMLQLDAGTRLVGADSRSIGIAEFGGVWIILVSPRAAAAAPSLEAAPLYVSLGTGTADYLVSGASSSRLEGLDGNDVLIGGLGNDTLNGGAGDDRLIGGGGTNWLAGGDGDDFLTTGFSRSVVSRPDLVKARATINNTTATAVSLDGFFDLDRDANTANASTTPHATVTSTSNGHIEYYRFTVTTAGSVGTFDIDGTSGFDSYLVLLNSAGSQLATDDDSPIDPGSTSGLDANLTYTFTLPGTYYIGVRSLSSATLPAGATYRMNVSLQNAAVTQQTPSSTLLGDNGNDVLVSDAGSDTLRGGAGSDTLRGNAGNDTLDGGAGFDAALYSGLRRQYTAGSTSVSGNGEGSDTLTGIEEARFVDGVLSFDENSAYAQVVRLFDAVLDRLPDQAGMEFQANALLTGGLTLLQLTDNFIQSTEFQARFGGLSNAAFIDNLFRFSLGRPGDAAGIQAWVDLLNSGVSRAQVVMNFSESPEHRQQLAPFVNAGLWIPDAEALIIARLYDAAFERLPDPAGLTAWLAALDSGAPLLQIAATFAGSPEFVLTYGALSNQQFVEQIYRACLNREGDAAGVQAWTSVLNSGASRAQVLVSFSESPEHVNLTAALWSGGIRFPGFVGTGADEFAPKGLDDAQVLPGAGVIDGQSYDPADLGLTLAVKEDDAFVLPGRPDRDFTPWILVADTDATTQAIDGVRPLLNDAAPAFVIPAHLTDDPGLSMHRDHLDIAWA